MENQEFTNDLTAASTPDDFISVKGHGFAGAGVSLAFILLLAQIAIPIPPHFAPRLLQSLILSSVALPMWLFFALTYDMWASLKLTPADLHTAQWRSKSLTAMAIVAGLLNLAAIWCLLDHFSRLSGGLFLLAVILGVCYLVAMLVAATKIRLQKFEQNKNRHHLG